MPRLRAQVALAVALLLFGAACSRGNAPQSEQVRQPIARIDPASAAAISGVVRFTGEPQAPQQIDMSADSGCKGQNQAETVVVDNGRLENVLIYVKAGLANRKFLTPADKVTITQKGCRFVPHVAAAMVGQPVEFRNGDDTLHNIHPIPKNNAEWNQSQLANGSFVRPFTAAEIMIPVKCNQHPWMRMYLSVLDNPFFAITGKDGMFTLAGLPPGTYTLAAIHEKYGEKDLTVTVGPKDDKRDLVFVFGP
jgi:plastocyanin